VTDLTDERRLELIERASETLCAWHLREPALVFLSLHAPLAFLGSQLLLAAQPLLGVLTGDRLARELALLLEEPANVELLVARLQLA